MYGRRGKNRSGHKIACGVCAQERQTDCQCGVEDESLGVALFDIEPEDIEPEDMEPDDIDPDVALLFFIFFFLAVVLI